MEMFIDEHLKKKLGFMESTNGVYTLNLSPYDRGSVVSLFIKTRNDWDNHQNDKVEISIDMISGYSISSEHNTVESALKWIDGVMSTFTLIGITKLIKILDFISISDVDIIKDEKAEKVNYQTLSIERTDLKDMLIPKLEEALKILKGE